MEECKKVQQFVDISFDSSLYTLTIRNDYHFTNLKDIYTLRWELLCDDQLLFHNSTSTNNNNNDSNNSPAYLLDIQPQTSKEFKLAELEDGMKQIQLISKP